MRPELLIAGVRKILVPELLAPVLNELMHLRRVTVVYAHHHSPSAESIGGTVRFDVVYP